MVFGSKAAAQRDEHAPMADIPVRCML